MTEIISSGVSGVSESLEILEIGNYCFSMVNSFSLYGLNKLKRLRIGNNSFTQEMNNYGNNNSRSFKIRNCESLESIEIGEYSFSDYSGGFELDNLKSLNYLTIGAVESTSSNFYFSSFNIRSEIEYNL